MECGPRCRSRNHILQVINTITKGSTKQIKAHISRCHCATSLSDWSGRTVLHVAVSCGKWEVVQWLLTERHVEVGHKDLESGWTALHRALFYGQVTCALQLIDHGANLGVRDKEGLTPLDIVMKDRLPYVEYSATGPCEVHTWGDNANFNLGHENIQRRKFPETVEVFRKNGISITQVCLSKYHTVFLDQNGRVHTCGHGHGGRLGHGNESTCMVPKPVEALKHETVTHIAAAKDHTVFLADSGTVYSCGLNDNHQLGHVPFSPKCLSPKPVGGKAFKGKAMKGVCASRFHTVIYTSTAIYTFGLNAGQLGHIKVQGETHQSQPRQVAALNHKDINIKLVTASDAATTVVTAKGDVFVLHEYQCRKIASKWLDIVQVAMTGGNLDHRMDTDILRERGGDELVIILLNTSGKVYMWREEEPVLKRCAWSIRRPLFITQVALSLQSICFITGDGEAFTATVPKARLKTKAELTPSKDVVASSPPADSFTLTLSDLVSKEEKEDLRVERLAQVHRAVHIDVDKKGRNHAVLQTYPKASLTEVPTVEGSEMGSHFDTLREEAEEYDLIHDVIVKVGSTVIPAHKYILSYRSEYFKKIFTMGTADTATIDKPVVEIDSVHTDLFLQLLKYIYTDTCDLLVIGKPFKFNAQLNEKNGKKKVDIPDILEDIDFSKPVSAFDVQEKRKKRKNKGGGEEDRASNEERSASNNPVKLLQEMAKRFGVKSLVKRLEAVRYTKGCINLVSGKCLATPKLKFERGKFPELYDVCIRSQDGREMECHKCVLVARLEYFHSMLASGWMETSRTDALSLPVPGDILNVVLDYIYMDDAPIIRDTEDAEFVCNVLVVADQLLMTRLKQLCEAAAVNLMSLKNACELLEFASMYNADQLKLSCQQFITINLAALIETRALDVLSEEVLHEFTKYYRDTVAAMSRRMITPYSDWPDHQYLEEIAAEYTEEEDTEAAVTTGNKMADPTPRKAKARKKRSRTKSTGEDTDSRRPERTISVGSDAMFPLDLEEIGESEGAESPTQLSPRDEVAQSAGKPLHVRSPGGGIWGPPNQVSPRGGAQGSSSSPLDMRQPHMRPISPSQAFASSPPPGQNVSLRTIMEQEQQSSELRQPATKSSSTAPQTKKSGKLSQKQRKKLSHAQQDVQRQQTAGATEGAKPKAWASPTSPWGAVNTIVQSFKELMVDDEETSAASPPGVRSQSPLKENPRLPSSPPGGAFISPGAGAGGEPHGISWGLPTSMARPARQATSSHQPASPSSPRENPWQHSPLPRNVSFTDIVRDEAEQKKMLQRNLNKPLGLIQLEEQAMQELLEYYKADENTDEHITVERVPTIMASPTWAATQRH